MIREKNSRTSSLQRIQTVVLQELQNNTKYIAERKSATPLFADFKYFTDKGIFTNLDETQLKAEINAAFNTTNSIQPKVFNDVIGQTFFIDKANFPNGLFLDGIDLYFYTKDTIAPVILEIVPTVNGYPSSDTVVPFSKVIKYPDTVNVTTNINVLPAPTAFTFDNPVYLQPGVYAFILRTNSSNYNVFISERGKASLIDRTVVTNPYNGDFFQSQQGTTWVADPTKDFCFRIRRCIFEVGSKTFNLFTNKSEEVFDGLSVNPHVQDFGDTTDISYSLQTYEMDVDGSPLGFTDTIEPNKNIFFDTVRTLETANSGANVNVTMFTSSNHVSPILDIDATTVVLLNNEISPYSANIANTELTASGGISLGKYVSKEVVLQEGFDSTGISVYVDVNRQPGTDIEVYVKIQNNYDYTTTFAEREWIKLPKVDLSKQGTIYSTDENSYTEELYQNLSLSYYANTATTSVLHSDFRKYAIKVVFYSDDTIKIPKIKNLRSISSL